MCNLAGKILQLQLGCFRANVLPSTKQRSDIWEQYSTAITELFRYIVDLDTHGKIPLDISHDRKILHLSVHWQNIINALPPPKIANSTALWRAVDLELALSIASGAGIATHDTLGNISSHVWTRRTNNTHLMAIQDIRRLLLDQIKTQLDNQKTSILEADDASTVVQWIVNYATEWQDQENIHDRQQSGRIRVACMTCSDPATL